MKKKYFRLVDDMTLAGRWEVGDVLLPDGDQPILGSLGPISPGPVEAVVHQPGHALEYSMTSLGWPLATAELAEAVKRVASSDVQCLPVKVARQPDMVILHSLRLVSCVDEERSTFTKWKVTDHRSDLAGWYRSITKLVLDRAAVPEDAHFFRIDRWPIGLIVSDSVKNAMEAVGCRGAVFRDVTP
ncbi:MAG: hypothetical protein EVA89_00680 [Sandaracinaceae bacterium]|nr:MAG: hypothetical protein EVA89_00680 [Sandaracinaceae bacterium]